MQRLTDFTHAQRIEFLSRVFLGEKPADVKNELIGDRLRRREMAVKRQRVRQALADDFTVEQFSTLLDKWQADFEAHQ